MFSPSIFLRLCLIFIYTMNIYAVQFQNKIGLRQSIKSELQVQQLSSSLTTSQKGCLDNYDEATANGVEACDLCIKECKHPEWDMANWFGCNIDDCNTKAKSYSDDSKRNFEAQKQYKDFVSENMVHMQKLDALRAELKATQISHELATKETTKDCMGGPIPDDNVKQQVCSNVCSDPTSTACITCNSEDALFGAQCATDPQFKGTLVESTNMDGWASYSEHCVNGGKGCVGNKRYPDAVSCLMCRMLPTSYDYNDLVKVNTSCSYICDLQFGSRQSALNCARCQEEMGIQSTPMEYKGVRVCPKCVCERNGIDTRHCYFDDYEKKPVNTTYVQYLYNRVMSLSQQMRDEQSEIDRIRRGLQANKQTSLELQNTLNHEVDEINSYLESKTNNIICVWSAEGCSRSWTEMFQIIVYDIIDRWACDIIMAELYVLAVEIDLLFPPMAGMMAENVACMGVVGLGRHFLNEGGSIAARTAGFFREWLNPELSGNAYVNLNFFSYIIQGVGCRAARLFLDKDTLRNIQFYEAICDPGSGHSSEEFNENLQVLYMHLGFSLYANMLYCEAWSWLLVQIPMEFICLFGDQRKSFAWEDRDERESCSDVLGPVVCPAANAIRSFMENWNSQRDSYSNWRNHPELFDYPIEYVEHYLESAKSFNVEDHYPGITGTIDSILSR